jgi:hypothetical protein
MSDNIGKAWTANWHIQKDEKSAVSKLSSMGESKEMMCSQLTFQQQENKNSQNLLRSSMTSQAKKQNATNSRYWKEIKNGNSTWILKPTR